MVGPAPSLLAPYRKELDRASEQSLLTALDDLVRVAGGDRTAYLRRGMFQKLRVGPAHPDSADSRELWAAAEAGDAQLVEALLNRGACLETRGKVG